MTAVDPNEPGWVIGRTYDDSTPWWPPLLQPPAGAPNVVVVLLDDVGYAQFGCYGSDIATPTFDRLAATGRRYSNFHTTALCSPTRACLLTGRNHHANGIARVVDLASGFPGYNTITPRSNGFLSEILVAAGYATFLCGKWHLAPATEQAMGSPRTAWPLGRGFERFYGFLGGETDQYHPELVHDGHHVRPPRTPDEGYHLTEDLVDHAIEFVSDLRATAPDKPYLLWLAPGACHAPHQAPASYIEAYRGAFDQGWDAWRDSVFERQVSSGLLPDGTVLSERPSWVPPWDSLSADEQRLYARMMEVYAGFLTHTDAQVGRYLDFVESLGETDDTLVLVMSDNGASAEGGAKGSFNEQYFFNFQPESMEENLARIDQLGTPLANNHYPWGWAWAGNTPLKRFKRDTHEGGVTDPLIVSWPGRLGVSGGPTRHQYVHAVDVLPTLLELVGVEAPAVLGGHEQRPFDGVSFAASLASEGGESVLSAHVTQYYEMLGSRALYHDGWKAVVFHPSPFLAYDGSDATRPFDDDQWELYHVAEDFAEVHDLAAAEPERLASMQELWWSEAERNGVLPLNNQPGRFSDPRHRRSRYEYRPGIAPIPETMAPRLRGKAWVIAAELEVPAGGTVGDGVLVAHGSHAGGYAFYLLGGRLRFTYDFLGTEITTAVGSVSLPEGRVEVRAEFTPTDRWAGDVALFHGDVPVGEVSIPRTTPLTYGTPGFGVGAWPSTPIVPELGGAGALPRDVLRRVVVTVEGGGALSATDEAIARQRVDLATQ